jgi:hypothetical protein
VNQSGENIDRSQTHECGNWDFLFWEYITRNFFAVHILSSSYLYFYGREIVEEMRRKCVMRRRRREGLQINRPEKRDENLCAEK